MAKTATVKITGDHHIIYGVDRQVLRKGSIVELPVSELAGWKNLYQVEVLSGDVYGPDDLPRLQKQARRLQGELAHVLRGLSECAEATGVPMDVAFEGLSDLPEFQGATDSPSEDDAPSAEGLDQPVDDEPKVPVNPMELIGGDWDELRAFVAEHADPHPGPSRSAHEEWIHRTYGGQ